LTLRELNRATLARQLLLARRKLSPSAAIQRLVGMQAQCPPAPYVVLWTRVEGFRREALERLLLRGEVLKPTVMRGTRHLGTSPATCARSVRRRGRTSPTGRACGCATSSTRSTACRCGAQRMAACSTTCPALRRRRATRPPPSGFCRNGTTPCSATRIGGV